MLHSKEKFKEFTCDNKQQIMDSIKSHNHSGYIWGKCGIGKTHLCYYLSNKFRSILKTTYVGLMADINRQVKQQMRMRDTGNIVEFDIITRLKNVDVLFLDDIGNEYATQYTVSEILQTVLDHRYKNEKPTVITSNYSLGELHTIYNEIVGGQKSAQLISRIQTFGEIEMKGKSWR